jgi:tetratricopeptide (TPR) repeat protein
MNRAFFDNLKTQYATFRDYRRKLRKKRKHRKTRETWLRFRMMALMGAFGFGYFLLIAGALLMKGYHTLGFIFLGLAVTSPWLGSLLFDILEFFSEHSIGQILWPSGGETAPAHSIGESHVYNERYEEAIAWFTNLAMSHPSDWRAQWRIVEILDEFLDDPERLAEERNRLLKTDGVPEGLWIQTAMDLGEEWEKLGYQDKAINTYKGFLWRIAEGHDADEVRRRLAELRAL